MSAVHKIDDSTLDEAHSIPIDEVADRLGFDLRREGHERVGPCLVCGGTDRFAINITKDVWHCRGCEAGGDGIELVRHVEGLGFVKAVEFLTGRQSSSQDESADDPFSRYAETVRGLILHSAAGRKRRERLEQEAADDALGTKRALKLWRAGQCIYGTPAEAYLRSRRCDGMFPIDRDAIFRFHPACPFGSERLPCLLSLLHNIETGKPQAVHRTALTADGQKIGRKMLGPCKGATVKLWPAVKRTRLYVAEGIETALSAAIYLNMRPAWACVSAGGIKTLPPIPGVEELIILVDRDENQQGEQAAETCSRVWTNAGRTVVRLIPKQVGTDFNDITTEVLP